MAPTAEEVKNELAKVVEQYPGNVWAPDALKTVLFRRLKTTSNCIENRLDVLAESGDLKRVVVRPGGSVSLEDGNNLFAPSPQFHPKGDSYGTVPSLTRGTISFERSPGMGNLWAGDRGRYYYTSAESYAAICDDVHATYEKITARLKEEQKEKESEAQTALLAVAPDASELLDTLRSRLGDDPYNGIEERVDGKGRLHLNLDFRGTEGVTALLDILRRGLT